jgi:hypothetical protein
VSDEDIARLRVFIDTTTEAPFDILAGERAVRYSRGYTDEVIALGNSMFPSDSPLGIKIASLIRFRETGEQFASDSQATPLDTHLLNGYLDCRPRDLIAVAKDYRIYLTQPIDQQTYFTMSPQKIVAIFKPTAVGGLPDCELYKAVAPLVYKNDGIERGQTKFWEASARCPYWQGSRHCCTTNHVNIESKYHNITVRKPHHSGTSGCFEEPGSECIGPRVVRNEWTETDEKKYLCLTPGCLRRPYLQDLCYDCQGSRTSRKEPKGRPAVRKQYAKEKTMNGKSKVKTCAKEGCDAPVRHDSVTGFCRSHLAETKTKSKLANAQVCKKDGCDEKLKTRNKTGMCKSHSHKRELRGNRCKKDGCDVKILKNNKSGFCAAHQLPCKMKNCKRRKGSSEYCYAHQKKATKEIVEEIESDGENENDEDTENGEDSDGSEGTEDD